ncbi:9401_t:CDS:2 [Racocetra persica]|uniref:9401_t:CDS:1 n=1 Tax=Racocetra persica TaxID=160502 RepID=A0ACA9KSK5_9GLOM|nr:9401_t:CDS:2 [Racocetra persica]
MKIAVETQETMRVRLEQKPRTKRSNSMYGKCQHVFKIEQQLQEVTLTQEEKISETDCQNFVPSSPSFLYTNQHAVIPNDAPEMQMLYQKNSTNDTYYADSLGHSFQEMFSMDISQLQELFGIFGINYQH